MILHGRVLTGGRELPASRVVVEGGVIAAIEPAASAAGADLAAGEGWIAPGLIDLQVNGAGGVDLASADDPAAAVAEVTRVLAGRGVTAFCPTLVSAPEERIVASLAAFDAGGASLGAHVEGPFIAPEHRRVHDPACLRLPELAEVERWLRVGRPAIVTLAPELPGALSVVRRLVEAGVVVSVGHSGASAVEVEAALSAGATMGTHLFNAMPALHHREPGVLGALLASEAVLGLIVDDVHVDARVVALAVRAAGTGRIALVSDSVAPAGAAPGQFRLGGQTIESDGRTVRRRDGTLAGSALLLDDCLRAARRALPWLSPAELVMMATEVPARALRLADRGRVAVGYRGDLIVLDRELRVTASIVAGVSSGVASPPAGSRSHSPARAAPPGAAAQPAAGASPSASLSATRRPSPTALDALATEQPNPRTGDLDRLPTAVLLERLNAEDATVAAAVRAALPKLARAVKLAEERWRRGGRIILFGAGTSGRLAMLDAAELPPTYGVDPARYVARMAGGSGAMQVAREGVEDDAADGASAARDLGPDDLAIGIAASGRTPWVIGALAEARRRGAATVGLACLPAPLLAVEADVTIVVDTGTEPIAGSTRMKAGTAQKLVLNALSTALMVRLGKVYGNLMVDVRVTNAKLRHRAVRLVARIADVDDAAAEAALVAAALEVKTAVVMVRLGLHADAARARLAAADGRLAAALGEAS